MKLNKGRQTRDCETSSIRNSYCCRDGVRVVDRDSFLLFLFLGGKGWAATVEDGYGGRIVWMLCKSRYLGYPIKAGTETQPLKLLLGVTWSYQT